jgi:hypothetical protein
MNVIKHASQTGYRHIDTAAGYQNGREVGIGIKKLWCSAQRDFNNQVAQLGHEEPGKGPVQIVRTIGNAIPRSTYVSSHHVFST